MPQIEALYVVEFGDVAIGGQTYTYWNGGVAVLETNRIFGGDSGYYYLGNYTIKDSQGNRRGSLFRLNQQGHSAVPIPVIVRAFSVVSKALVPVVGMLA
jgi:hypothetical protein